MTLVPYKTQAQLDCDHGVSFPENGLYLDFIAKHFTSHEVRQFWPRHSGVCEKCGYNGIAYASQMHFLAGDW